MRAPWSAALAAAGLVVGPFLLQAQGTIRVAAGAAEIGAEMAGQRSSVAGGAAEGARELRSWASLPFSGSMAGPGLFAWSLSLRPTFQRRSQTAYQAAITSRQLDLSGGARLFGAQPISLSLDAMRARGTTNGGFGGRRDFNVRQTGATLWWRTRAFPMQLGFQHRRSDDQWVPSLGAAPLRVAQRLETLRFAGGSSKTSLDFQRARLDDAILGVGTTSWTGTALHTLRWGRGSRLESVYELADQQGATATARRRWSERLHVVHASFLSSDHRVERATAAIGPLRSVSTGLASSIHARIGPRVSAGLGFSANRTAAGAVRTGLVTVTPRAAVALPVGGSWRMSASAAWGLERRTGMATSTTELPVVDEPHVVPATRTFALREPRVDPASLTVRNTDGTFVYEAGLDFAVTTAGDVTRVDVPPGSRITEDETVLVSYRYRPIVPDRLQWGRLEYEVSLVRRGLEFRHTRLQRTGPSGVASRLTGAGAYADERSEARVNAPTPVGELRADLALRRWRREGPAATDWQAGIAWTPPTPARLSVVMGGSWSQGRSAGITTASLAGQTQVAWHVGSGLSVRLGVDALEWRESTRTQRFLSLLGGADWTLGSLVGGVAIAHHRRRYVVAQDETVLNVRLVRRF